MYNPDNITLFAMQPIIPSVLQQPNGNSLSTSRVLNDAINLLQCLEYEIEVDFDRLDVCLADLQTMLASIHR